MENKGMKPLPSASKTNRPTGVYIIADDHSGRDEMNLAGNPFALLHPGGRHSGEALIKYEWNRTLEDGRVVKASWEVAGHPEMGLPGPSDELLYLVLLEITREAGNGGKWPQQVHFSRFNLLARIGWPDSTKFYKLLRDCFARLQSVSIHAEYSFYDARNRKPLPAVGFHILESYVIADEPKGRKSAQSALPLSYFKWSDELYTSFGAGNIRSLALDYVKSLEVPTARRLFRYLDMHRNAQKPPRPEFVIRVMKLRDHIGMVNLRHISKVKERLETAHQELLKTGYLQSVEYRRGREGEELVAYRFAKAQSHAYTSPTLTPAPAKPERAILLAPPPRLEIYPIEAKEVYDALLPEQREALINEAKTLVSDLMWDRLEDSSSPISLALWELVIRDYPEAYDKAIE